MSEYVAINRSGRMTAPRYMQPRKPVLDEPLDIDCGRQTVAMPTHQTVIPTPVVAQVQVETAPVLVEEPILAVNTPAKDNIYYAELAAQQNVAAQPAQFVGETVEVDEVEVEAAPERKRRKLTTFQQWIVILLEVAVVLILATVYLYITDRIDMPEVVLDTIEKGLSLISAIK
ncbi:hypothetical protein JR338_07665 [Chloroflexota bacterium]|nr:hypothetical protein JR338_07665 [Chloroflexota bacterium]